MYSKQHKSCFIDFSPGLSAVNSCSKSVTFKDVGEEKLIMRDRVFTVNTKIVSNAHEVLSFLIIAEENVRLS